MVLPGLLQDQAKSEQAFSQWCSGYKAISDPLWSKAGRELHRQITNNRDLSLLSTLREHM